MAVYRADQAQVTFMTEPAAGGYVEMAPVVSSSSTDTTLDGVHVAGSRSILVSSSSGMAVGDTIEIGHTGTDIVVVGHPEIIEEQLNKSSTRQLLRG